MKKTNTEAENARLKVELSSSKKENVRLSQKLDKSTCKVGELQSELKKRLYNVLGG